MYVMYVLFACATAFLLAEPIGPLTRLARFLIGLVLVFLLWRPLVQVPGAADPGASVGPSVAGGNGRAESGVRAVAGVAAVAARSVPGTACRA